MIYIHISEQGNIVYQYAGQVTSYSNELGNGKHKTKVS